MIFQSLFQWSYGFLEGSNILVGLLNSQIFNGWTMLSLLSIGGLVAYLGVAVTKWLIS